MTRFQQMKTRLAQGRLTAGEARDWLKAVEGSLSDARAQSASDERDEQIRDWQAVQTQLLQVISGNGASSAVAGIREQLDTTALSRIAGSTQRFGNHIIATVDRSEMASWSGGALAEARTASGGVFRGGAMAAAGDVLPTTNMQTGPFAGVVPLLQAGPRFLDLVPTDVMEVPSLPYAQEVTATGAPAPTAPGTAKPPVGFSYEDAEAVPATVAGWLKMQKQTLADVPSLLDTIRTRLFFKTRLALEAEVLSGDGTVSDQTGKPGIVGLLNTTGVGIVPHVGGTLPPDEILDGIVSLLATGAVPNVIAMNEQDYGDLLKTKAAGSGEYVSNPFLMAAQSVWGVTITPAHGVPAGQMIVGDTTVGMKLYVREAANILISDADTDDMTKNKVTLLCEGRWALAVFVPTAFCIVETARFTP
jgi:hypothetical protein